MINLFSNLETLSKRKEKAKNDIILRALSEFSDLEALRAEKRAIMEEEQRLRALLALEKTTVNKKADRQAAMRAQQQRRDAKAQHRRQKYRDSLDQVLEEEGKPGPFHIFCFIHLTPNFFCSHVCNFRISCKKAVRLTD